MVGTYLLLAVIKVFIPLISRALLFFFLYTLSLVSLFFATPCFGLSADIPETFRISRIDIDGTHHLKKKSVRSELTVLPPAPWRLWRTRPVASVQDLADEANRISLLYQRSGFYHAAVTYEVQLRGKSTDPAPAVRVLYAIEEGEPVVVESITIGTAGIKTDVSVDDLVAALPLKTGHRFEEKVYRESKQLILKKFGNEGYPFAEVAGKAFIYPDTNRAILIFSVTPGRLCFFGETTVTWDTPLINEKILIRSRTYRQGEIYNTAKVDKSQRNLYNLDVFKAAVIEPGDPDTETGIVPLSLELKPKKRRNIKLGVGYGDEDGIRLKAGYTYRNPFSWGGKMTLEVKRTDLLQKGAVSYNQPFFLDARSALQAESGILQEFLDSYESRKLFGNVKFTRNLDHHLDLTLAYLMEYSELKDLNLIDPAEVAAFREDHAFFTSSVFSEMIRNTADSDTNPEKGSTLSVSLEVASTLLGSELTYVHPSLEFKKYIELPLQTLLAVRFKMESITDMEKNQEIPIFKRLFLGGANTVRGYAYQKMGPLDETGNPQGGQSSMLANVELRHPIVGILSAVLFLDGGMLDQDRFSFDNDELRWSTGAGLRVATPVGPIRLDFGYQLNPPDTGIRDGQNAQQMDRWRLHLNIGHTF